MTKGIKIRKIIRYAVSVALALVLMWFSFKGVNWSDFVKSLTQCNLAYIGLAMAAAVMAVYLRGARWRQLLLPLDGGISRLTSFNAYNIGYLANFVLPRIGEFVRCGVISENSAPATDSEATGNEAPSSEGTGNEAPSGEASCAIAPSGKATDKKASYDKVLGTVILERSWDMLTMLTILIVFLLFSWSRFGTFFIEEIWLKTQSRLNFSLWWIILALVLATAGLIWAVIATKEKFAISGKICKACSGLLTGISSCLKMKRKGLFILYTALIWLMYWLMSFAIIRAVGAFDVLGPVDALFLMLAGSFGWLVPVPGGFGAFHFIVATALTTVYGLSFDMGIIFATLSHESQAITMVLCGLLSYLYEYFLRRRGN